MRRPVAWVLGGAVLALLAGAAAFVPIGPGEIAVVLTPERAARAQAGPALVFRLPWRDAIRRVPAAAVEQDATWALAVGDGQAAVRLRLSLAPDAGASPQALAMLAEGDLAAAATTAIAAAEAALRASATPLPSDPAALQAAVRAALEPLLSQQGLRVMSLEAGASPLASSAPGATTPDNGVRILLIGIDGADWDFIDPLVAAGKLPNLGRLRAAGAWGLLRGEPPLLSPLLWTTAATGKPPDEHGIADFVMLDPKTKAPTPISSRFRRVKAFWNILSESGLPVSVVGWWATWPAEAIEGVMVTERVAYSLFAYDRGPETEGMTYPASYGEAVARLRVTPEAISREQVAAFADVSVAEWDRSTAILAAGGEQAFADPLCSLRQTLAATLTYHRVALDLLQRGEPRLMAIYYQGLDEVSHHFAHLMPPPHPLGSDAERARFGRVIPAFYELQDRLLGDLLAASTASTHVMILSDHGFARGAERPRDYPPFVEAGRPGRWHTRDGIWLLAGPNARPGRLAAPVRMDQVTPTLLRLLGLPLADDMPGGAVEAAIDPAFLRAHPARRISTYEAASGTAPPVAAGGAEEGKPDPMLAKLRSLGYLAPGGDGGEGGGAGAAVTSANFHANLGVSLMARREYARAREEFLQALAVAPGHVGARGGLVQMDIEEGRLGEALDGALAIVRETRGFDPVFYYVAAQLYVRNGRTAAGLEEFRTLVRDLPEVAQAHTGLGVLLLASGDREGAKQAFRRSLDLKPDALYALQELYSLETPGGDLEGLLRRCEAAIDALPQSVLPYNWAGLALRRLGRPVEAEDRFRQALRIEPRSARSLVNLSSLLVDSDRAPQAIPLLAQAIAADPGMEEARINLVVALGRTGRLAEARRAYQEAGGEGDVASPDLLNAMAFACYLNGAADEAEGLLQRSLARNADQPEARRLLGRIRGTSGR